MFKFIMLTVLCPICKKQLPKVARYPNYLCSECCEKAVTEKGDKISFNNVDIFGGFKSIINGEEGEEHTCYIDDHKCLADEARFGGIVIRKI
mgnify:CR=1 FL=1